MTRTEPMKSRTRQLTLNLIAAALLAGAGAASAAVTAIRNAQVMTVAGAGTLERGTVLIRNGRIEAVGADVAIPEGAAIIDGSGKVLTPGIFVARSELGLKEIDAVDETNDVASRQSRYTAALDVTDALNPRSALLPVNRIEGVTRTLTAPETGKGGGLFAGQGAIISLAGALAEPGAFVVRPRAAMFAVLGEQAKGIAGTSRTSSIAAFREALEEAKSNGLRLGSGLSNDAQLSALDIEALRPVLTGETPLVITAHRASDILAALKLADDYRLRLIISGATEAHLVAKELAAARVPVLIDPTRNLPAQFGGLHARPDSALILRKAGVVFAFVDSDDKGTHNARNLRQVAGIAVSYGYPKDQALAAITLQPAEILGLSTVLGSIEAGKIADLVLWDGDPLEVTTAATAVWIDGVPMPMISRQTLLRDRYLQRIKAADVK